MTPAAFTDAATASTDLESITFSLVHGSGAFTYETKQLSPMSEWPQSMPIVFTYSGGLGDGGYGAFRLRFGCDSPAYNGTRRFCGSVSQLSIVSTGQSVQSLLAQVCVCALCAVLQVRGWRISR